VIMKNGQDIERKAVELLETLPLSNLTSNIRNRHHDYQQ
jgi:hypothetical protein